MRGRMEPFAPVALLGAAGPGPAPIIGGIVLGWAVAGGLLARNRLHGLGAAALMGLGVSLYLGVQHHPSMGSSVCSVSDVFNCDTVNRSQYSEIGGVPIAFLGAGFYGAVLLAVGQALRGAAGHLRVGPLVFLGALLSVAYSAFLGWASVQLGAWCLFCISLYGVNLLLLGGSFLESRGAAGRPVAAGLKALFEKDDKTSGSMVTGFILVFALSMFGYNRLGGPAAAAVASGGGGGDVQSADLVALFEASEGPVELDGTEPVYGDPSAPYTIVEWADYECPYCARVAPELKSVIDANPKVRLIFKHYPINMGCNPSVEFEGHANACRAAAAAECALKQGRFWDLSALLFKNQQYLDADGIGFMAKQAGLDEAAFGACLTDPATTAAVSADAVAGARAGVHGTPSLFLKGVTADGAFVHVKGGADVAAVLIAAHQKGVAFPPTPAFTPDGH